MAINAISKVEPSKRNNPSLTLSAGAGALAGAASRYVIPTKDEMKSVDTFVSSSATAARSSGRSILKFGGIGAAVALGLNFLYRAFNVDKKPQDTTIEYTKLGALIDAPYYACEIMWYGE